jgi:DNA-binding transcriptional LysR family regulator
MELRQLRHFLALMEHNSLRRAAAALHITPQALSASISRLEEDCGVVLFERGSTGVAPTRFAESLLPRATLVCAEAARARAELEQLARTKTRRLAIGVGWFSSQALTAMALQRFLAQEGCADVTVIEGTSEELHVRLLRGELDLVLSTPSAEIQIEPQLETEILFESTDLVYARSSHPLRGRRSVTLADVVPFPWIISAGIEARSPRLFDACDAQGVPRPTHVVRTDSSHVIQRLISGGDFLMLGGAMPAPFRPPFMDECIELDVPDLARRYYGLLAWRRAAALIPAAMRLRALLREVFGAQSPRPPHEPVTAAKKNFTPLRRI